MSAVQCPPPVGFEDEGLSHINCARQKCNHCPKYPRPELEKKLGVGDHKIFFYHYEVLPTCSRCGPCDKSLKECPTCAKKKGGGKIGSFQNCKHLVLKHLWFDDFWDNYYMVHLKRYQMHYWKMVMHSKRFWNDLREHVLNSHDVLVSHDFTEALCLDHNNQTQSTGYGSRSSTKCGIEGYTVLHHSDYDHALKLVFHSFLSDSTVQEARTVFYHLKQLIQTMIDNHDKLIPGSRLLCITDGCAKVSDNKTNMCLYFCCRELIISLLLFIAICIGYFSLFFILTFRRIRYCD